MTITDSQDKKPKRNLTWLFIVIPIAIIATCNYIVNTQDEKKIIEKPVPGDYFVIRGLLGEQDQAFKVKAIVNDTIEFFIPKFEMFDFKRGTSESKIRNLDKENKLYDPSMTIKIPKSTIDSLQKNSEFSGRVLNHSKIYLKGVFK